MRSRSRPCFFLLAAALGSGYAHAQYSYAITDLGAVPFGASSYFISEMNNSGHFVGWTTNLATGQRDGFLYANGSYTNLGFLAQGPGGVHMTWAHDINDAGQITGTSTSTYPTGTVFQAYIYESGVMTGLGISYGYTLGQAINSHGHVAGLMEGAFNGYPRGFINSSGTYDEIGTIFPPDPLTGLQPGESDAQDINDVGHLVGSSNSLGSGEPRAIHYDGTTMTDLGTLGGVSSVAFRINSSGLILGRSQFEVGNLSTRPFLYWNGTMTDLGTLGGAASQAYDLNEAGQVVGRADLAGGGSHAFIYTLAGGMQDLHAMVALSDGSVPGFTDFTPYAINDVGQILAAGLYFDGVSTENRIFMLTAIPEPSTYALVGGLFVLVVVVCLRRDAVRN